ncbi:MAG TPA: ATP-dependent Clp protease ATP-binding subunit [Patescibacteria group bacterium]|nr:ATP-dependent Clp protease ATP-binding subunit [Patescibacteria group bacterium]
MLGNLFGSKRTDFIAEEQVVPPVQSPPVSPVPAPVSPPAAGISNMQPVTPVVKEDMTVLSHLDQRSLQVLSSASREAMRLSQQFISPEYLLMGLLNDNEIFTLIEQFSLKAGDISREIQSHEQQGNYTGQPSLGEDTKRVLEQAYTLSKERKVEFVMPEDILMALLSSNMSASAMLASQGIEKEGVSKKLAQSAKYNFGNKSLIAEFGTDLTKLAEEGKLDPVTGRDNEIDRIIRILLRRIKNNPIVIGEAGVGKTAVVEGLAQLIAAGKVPPDLAQKRIIQLDVASLIAGASHRGEFEERMRNIIKEVQMSSGRITLFIDEIHTLIGAGQSDGALDASNIIKPFLARGQIQLIGSTTTSEYRKYFEKDKAFERRFQEVFVEEPTEEIAVKMMQVLKPKYEAFHHVSFSDDAIIAAVSLSKRYIGERYLPDKAIDVLDEAAANTRLLVASQKRQSNVIVREDIENVISKWTGIPITKLTENESEKLLHLENLIHKRLINQEIAVQAIAEAVRRGRIGLSSSTRPIASFIFLGPTGVGKTELAKTLAEILFGKEEAMIRLDMSEYMEKHEVAKLIGAPPGYVGYEEGGQLTEAVRSKPYSVVLLDEVEKAHPDVFNILLQILEDGRLTDNKGNVISFKNTIIIATSNIGSALIQQQLQTKTGMDAQRLKQLNVLVNNELHKFFKPELLNRFDEIIIFEPLGKSHMVEIAKLQLQGTRKLLMSQQVAIAVTQQALNVLAEEGFDPVYGARPLRRLIQTAIENPIARLLIEKKFVAGDTIFIDYDQKQQKFAFTKQAGATPVPPAPTPFPQTPTTGQPPVPPPAPPPAPFTPVGISGTGATLSQSQTAQ